MTKKNAMKWVNALRSGKYKQTIVSLQDGNGYCCLGVACDIFIPKNKQKVKRNHELWGGEIRDQKNAPLWLKNLYKSKELDEETLMSLNDHKGHTFNEIADVIQIVYVEGGVV